MRAHRAFRALTCRLLSTRSISPTALGPSGTLATAVPVSPSFVPVSDPRAPFADQSGLVAAPNTDPVNMLVQAAIAKYTFSANANVAKAADQMTKSLLDILS
jgi:flagellar basal-body rod protein FlgC